MIERATTNDVQVEVESRFVPEQSDIGHGRYFFAYLIRITNNGRNNVQLLNRKWIITDGWGRVEVVEGPGVIGQQPWIAPGESFEYESFCPLSTPTGTMSGHYEMVWAKSSQSPAQSTNLSIFEESKFLAEIPQFFLVELGSFH